jgi:hypothetical protein
MGGIELRKSPQPEGPNTQGASGYYKYYHVPRLYSSILRAHSLTKEQAEQPHPLLVRVEHRL